MKLMLEVCTILIKEKYSPILVTPKLSRKESFLDKETEKIYNKLEKKIGSDKEISITSRNKNEDKLLIYTGSDKTRGSYFFYDVKGDDLKHLADLAPWINPEHMASMNPISYTSRDGIKINGYLTLPVGVEAKNFTSCGKPAWGPWSRDYWGYNPEIQLLANRGYAVLQMNFRGSTGYGKEFWEMSFKKWGQEMQNDITDGVQWLIDEGIADKDRIAIYGASYGGYATLAGITNTPDLYAVAVDYVGVSNLFTFIEAIPPTGNRIKKCSTKWWVILIRKIVL